MRQLVRMARKAGRLALLVIRVVGIAVVVWWRNLRSPGFAQLFAQSLREQRDALASMRHPETTEVRCAECGRTWVAPLGEWSACPSCGAQRWAYWGASDYADAAVEAAKRGQAAP